MVKSKEEVELEKMSLSLESIKLGGNTTLKDGTYYGVAKWNAKAKDYLDIPGLYFTEYDARESGGGNSIGSRLVRWTVFKNSVTTRKGLR